METGGPQAVGNGSRYGTSIARRFHRVLPFAGQPSMTHKLRPYMSCSRISRKRADGAFVEFQGDHSIVRTNPRTTKSKYPSLLVFDFVRPSVLIYEQGESSVSADISSADICAFRYANRIGVDMRLRPRLPWQRALEPVFSGSDECDCISG